MAAPDFSQTLSATMANGMDRLEKMFTKKRAAPSRSSPGISRANSLVIRSNQSAPSIPRFPQPSFIQPTSTRMVAREEPTGSRGSRAAGRAQSLPESTSPRQLSSTDLHDTRSYTSSRCGSSSSSNNGSTSYLPRIPHRSSSLLTRRDACLASLATFRLQHMRSQSAENSPLVWDSLPASPSPMECPPQLKLQLDDLGDLDQILLSSRADTPPPSDPDEGLQAPTGEYKTSASTLPIPSQHAQPTPDLSPEMSPVPDCQVAENPCNDNLGLRPLLHDDSTDNLPQRQASSRRRPLNNSESEASPSLRSKTSKTRLMPAADPVLREPDFSDFLSLDDDDIAEEARPVTPPPATNNAQTAAAPTLATPTPSPPTRRFLLRSREAPSSPPPFQAPSAPPKSSHGESHRAEPPKVAVDGRLTAAFEIARIASRYRLDVAYVLCLWPKKKAGQQEKFFASASPTLSPTTPTSSRDSGSGGPGSHKSPLEGQGDFANMRPQGKQLVGQFMAAYGLATVKHPFRLNGKVHSRVLNAEDWLEFRNPDAGPEEFARGYGHAFYQGNTCILSQPSTEGWDADTEADDEGEEDSGGRATPRPRRRPAPVVRNNRGIVFVAYRRPTADGAGLESDKAELDALYADAHALVETILDFHVLRRRRERIIALGGTPPANDPLEVPRKPGCRGWPYISPYTSPYT